MTRRLWWIVILLTALVVCRGRMSGAEGVVVGESFAILWTASPTPQLSEYRVYVSKSSGQYDRWTYLAVPAPATRANGAALQLMSDGQYYLVMTGVVQGIGESVYSEEVPFVRQAGAPAPEADNMPPVVSIRAPRADADVPKGTSFQIVVDASDNVGVTRLGITVNGQALPGCILFNPPWRCAWKIPGVAGRKHTINAQALDASGNNAQHEIEVTAR